MTSIVLLENLFYNVFLVKFKRVGTSVIKELISKTMATESITETTVKQSKQRMDRGHCWELGKWLTNILNRF